MENIFIQAAFFLLSVLRSVWFWILVAVFLFLLLLIFLYRKCKLYALGELEYGRAFSTDGVFAGETFTFTETLHNPTWFPLFAVEAYFFMPPGFTVDDVKCREYTRITSVCHVPPHATVQKTHTVRADRRGAYRFESVTVMYRKNEFPFSAPIFLYVYPSNAVACGEEAPDLFRAGNHIASRKYIEDPFFLTGIRPYRIGDPLRTVNFKASIRALSYGERRLMSNEYDSSRNFDAMIVLDIFGYDEHSKEEPRENYLEEGLSYAAYLLTETLKQSGNVGFASNSITVGSSPLYIPCGSGSLHAKRILESLATITYTGRDISINSLLLQIGTELPLGADLYLLSPFIDPRTAETLRSMERRGRNVSVIRLRGRMVNQ